MTTTYYTATSLDGFIADEAHSLSWLLKQKIDMQGPMNYNSFLEGVGALILGASTFLWVQEHDQENPWPYTLPTWVFTHRDLSAPQGTDVRFVQGNVRTVHAEAVAAAKGKDVWVLGGGDLAGQFADAGLLDEVWVQYAPVTLGGGAPLLPRRLDLELIDFARNEAFLCGRYRVLGTMAHGASE